jgi:hypothetical protein
VTGEAGHYLAANRAAIERDLRDSWKRKYLSPMLLVRPGATLLFSAPFLAWLHGEPYDYLRYARYGLDHLLTGARFQVIQIVPAGSIFSFLGHQVSTALLMSTYRIPVARELAFLLSGLMVVLPYYRLDRLPELRRKMPAGYVVVALKA